MNRMPILSLSLLARLLQGESLSGSLRWDRDILRMERAVLVQRNSRYELQGMGGNKGDVESSVTVASCLSQHLCSGAFCQSKLTGVFITDEFWLLVNIGHFKVGCVMQGSIPFHLMPLFHEPLLQSLRTERILGPGSHPCKRLQDGGVSR